jgi:hypothetical protein
LVSTTADAARPPAEAAQKVVTLVLKRASASDSSGERNDKK